MLKKIDKRIPIIIVLTIIYSITVYLYLKEDSPSNSFNFSNMFGSSQTSRSSSKTGTIISTTTEIQSALTENVDLHTSYYIEKLYVEENQKVASGKSLVKYTNEEVLKAPYDCVIKSISVPKNEETIINNNHYIEISSLNALKMELNVSESKVAQLQLGQEATIKISALDGKTYTGYITQIGNKANNGYFKVVVEFENDGEVMIGMSANITI